MPHAIVIAALLISGSTIVDVPPTTTPAATSSALIEDPKVTALAKGEFTALQQGKIDRSHYTQRAAAALTDALVTQTGAQLAQLGALKSISLTASQAVQADTVYVYALACANGNLTMTFALDKDGLIDGMYFRPA